MPTLTPETRVDCIRNMISATPRRENIQRYVELAHALTEASLRTSTFHRSAELGISSRSDLALDAISDLFERDFEGRFIRLIRYFEEQDYRSRDARELWTLNRRLIAGTVSDALFRNYRESDPSLARIIRNLKRGIQKSNVLDLATWMGQAVVVTNGSKDKKGASWTIEAFSSQLIPWASNGQRMPDLLDGIRGFRISERDSRAPLHWPNASVRFEVQLLQRHLPPIGTTALPIGNVVGQIPLTCKFEYGGMTRGVVFPG